MSSFSMHQLEINTQRDNIYTTFHHSLKENTIFCNKPNQVDKGT